MKKNRTNWTRGAKIIFVASLMISFCEARYLGSYTARLSSQDHYNSRGGRLTKYYSILRQDRANYHKFGKSDSEDTGDSVFGSKKMRSSLPRMAKRGNISSSTRYAIESGTPLVEVEIYSDHINVSTKSSSSSTGSSSELLGSYTARLSSQDHYNSSGNRLTKYYSILRQDRANYHKFGKSDTEDTGDSAFGSKKMRSRLPSMAKRGGISSSVIDAIENGTPVVEVDVYANRLEIGLADSGSGSTSASAESTDDGANIDKKDITSREYWWSVFKKNRKKIAKQYREISMETINKLAMADTLKISDSYGVTNIDKILKLRIVSEYLKFAGHLFYEIKDDMSKKEPKLWEKLEIYGLIFDFNISGEEIMLVSKYNPGSLMDSMHYLDKCVYDNSCYNIFTNLKVLYHPENKNNISEKEFSIIDNMIIKFLERGCNHTLVAYSTCSNSDENGCYGFTCNSLARIYSGNDSVIKNIKKNTEKALNISKTMCYEKSNAEACGVYAAILIDKGTKYYKKAKDILHRGCNLKKQNDGNICMWCCEGYQNFVDKGW